QRCGRVQNIAGRSKSYGGQAGGQVLETGLFWFELKLLGVMGFAPRLNACLQCRRPLLLGAPRRSLGGDSSPVPGRGNALIAFSAVRGGVFCSACAGQHKNTLIRIMPDSLALLRFWQSSQKIHAARNVVCNERQLKDVGIILGNFLQYHLETDNTGREIALALLREHRKLAD
ncbi:MAG: DNA repair protein RecO C-terminal domain-containing protein, partial [Kiritimatiellia bacterium]|nr:DNA repair protein RecO C-terminal domain-containing protein [Kiritimatiellia bacterium]